MKIRMKKNKTSYILQIIVILLVSSCQPKLTAEETSFKQLFPDVKMNSEFTIIYEKEGQNEVSINYTSGENINLVLVFNSKKNIWFPNSFGLKTYTYKNNNWVELENQKIITDFDGWESGFNLDKLRGYKSIIIIPKVENKDLPQKIRVVIIGNIAKGSEFSITEITNKKVGSFIDILLLP